PYLLQDCGFNCNPPEGGPADTETTGWIQNRANELLRSGIRDIRRSPFPRALGEAHERDFVTPYVDDLGNVIDMEAIREAGLKLGVDPLGGSSLAYWDPIANRYG